MNPDSRKDFRLPFDASFYEQTDDSLRIATRVPPQRPEHSTRESESFDSYLLNELNIANRWTTRSAIGCPTDLPTSLFVAGKEALSTKRTSKHSDLAM